MQNNFGAKKTQAGINRIIECNEGIGNGKIYYQSLAKA